ncbi:dynein axonemal assembly factor 4-like [Neocloeon triangulifer]|uniref:dynein axonemal assembly factor 4-like n=1 Tax=Neocloeon triangulifer TaxID=2078957 RepID=UPI00286F4BF1|nr:dynein axonemal assembly factor 4-like [Neocloeon triangulifer]
MPIVLKEYSWHQNTENVLLKVKTGYIQPSAKSCTVLITSQYLKFSLPPFIFELFLSEKIKVDDVKVTYGSNHVTFTLPKEDTGKEWTTIETVGLDKEKKQKWRSDAELEQHEWHKNRDEAKQKHNEKLIKKNVEHQIEEKEANRLRIERLKKEIVRQALEDTLQWKQTLPADNQVAKSVEKIKSVEVAVEAVQEIFEEETDPEEPFEFSVAFTPRVFPTPKRESHKPMEDKWKLQREEAMKLVGCGPEVVEKAEPGWLYDKARELVQDRKYQGAAALASHALGACPSHAGLRLVLAVAYLHLGHWYQAIECSSRAIEQEGIEAEIKAKLIVVRGAALLRSGREQEGKEEIKIGLNKCKDVDDKLLAHLLKDLKFD